MLDLICISARNESEVRSSLKNFAQFSSNVIVARHPDALPLDNTCENICEFCGERTYIKRLYQALKLVKTKHVLLAADDDFYVPSSALRISSSLEQDKNFSCVSALSLNLTCEDSNTLGLSPYLVSSEIIKSKSSRDSVERIRNYFKPLSIDFYTIYSTEKLRLVLDIFINRCQPRTLECIGVSMKLFQYLFSFALASVGNIIPISSPLYVRGLEKPLRKQESYTSSLIDRAELSTFATEVRNFLLDSNALNDFISCLYPFYSNFSSSQIDHISLSLNDISAILKNTLISCVSQIRLDIVELYAPKYEIRISRSAKDLQVFREKGHLVFIYPQSSLLSCEVPSFLQDPLSPFILNSNHLPDIQSFVNTFWDH